MMAKRKPRKSDGKQLKDGVVSMPIADVIEDMDLYPRHAVDDGNVRSLVLALQSGCQLPPPVIDSKSKRIVDGWHRVRAYKRVLGASAVVDIEVKTYRNDAEMICDAVQRNAAHGRRFDAIDRTRAVLMLEKHGLSTHRIAVALNMPEDNVTKIRIKVATAPAGSKGLVPGTTSITLKRPVRHLQGTRLSKSQADMHSSLPGTSFLLIARQLCGALREGMVDLEDEKLMTQLAELRDLLVERIVAA
jgi:hypothetical protein